MSKNLIYRVLNQPGKNYRYVCMYFLIRFVYFLINIKLYIGSNRVLQP